MTGDVPADDPADGAALRAAGARLCDAVDAAVGPWIERSVLDRLTEPPGDRVQVDMYAAIDRARAEVMPRLRDLLSRDLDEQWTNPLAVIRTLVPYPTAVLAAAGATPADRDDDARRLQPDDIYDLSPATFADLGPDVHEPGLVWGATKAHLHLQRRKPR